MKLLNSRASVIGVFFAAVALLILYLLSVRWHIYLPVTVFWAAVFLMLSTIVYQILGIELSPSYAKVVLLEIAVSCFAFHLIYQIPYYGLVGSDAYRDMASAKGILSSGFVMGGPQYITEFAYFPLIHVFGAVLSLIAGIDLFSVAKWFPSMLDVVLILVLYLLVRRVFKKEKIALLSVLLFACLEHHVLFSSLFIRETYALVLAVCCVYLCFSALHSPHPATNYALSIMFLIETVFAHHLTSFMLVVFLLVHLLVTKASKAPFLKPAYFGKTITGEKVTVTFLSIAFVTIFAYWTYVATSPLYTLTIFVREVFTPGHWGVTTYAGIAGISGASIQTIRGYIIFFGFYFFHLVFGLILLYGLLPRSKNRRVETYSFTSFLFLCGLLGFLTLYVVAPAAFPDRFLMFGWLFGFAPLVAIILKGKQKWPKRVGILLLVAFMLLNIYMIDPSAWDARAERGLTVISEEEYALANTFNFSTGKIFGPQNIVVAIYDVHNNFGTTFTLPEVNLTAFNWVIIQKKMLELEKKYYEKSGAETIGPLERFVTEYFANYSKIYDSDSSSVFILKQ